MQGKDEFRLGLNLLFGRFGAEGDGHLADERFVVEGGNLVEDFAKVRSFFH